MAGVLQVALTAALVTHTFLGSAQMAGFLQGDYDSHAHGSIVAVGLGIVTAAMCAIFLYTVHLAGLGRRSLPSLARALRAQLGWQTVVVIGLVASVLLCGMETCEQLAAGRFDGALSAFGDAPALGLALILGVSAAVTGLLRALCGWLVDAHTQIVSLISLLFRDHPAGGPLRARFPGELLAATSYACDPSNANGKRAPPVFR